MEISETNEINHSLGVSVCWFLCTSFLRQPTAKLDYVFSFSSIFLLTRTSFAFQNNKTTKKKRKKSTRQKKTFFLSQQQPFSFGPALISLSFPCTVLGFASFQHFWSIKKLNVCWLKKKKLTKFDRVCKFKKNTKNVKQILYTLFLFCLNCAFFCVVMFLFQYQIDRKKKF